MDYELDLSILKSKSSDLESLKTSSENIYNEFSSSLNNLSNTELSSLNSKLKESITRLKKGYTNCNNWYKNYLKELKALEDDLSSFNVDGLEPPKEFEGTFPNLFGKNTIPTLKTKVEEPTKTSGVLSYQVGELPAPGSIVSKLGKKAVLLDVQVDGHSLGRDGSITIKRGQEVRLKVKIPDEVQNVGLLKRTSADGENGWTKYAHAHSEPSVNRYDKNTFLPIREYEWVITGDKVSKVKLSQTIHFSTDQFNELKGMVLVNVNIVD